MYKLSRFNHLVELGGKYIIYNFYTSAMVEVEGEFLERIRRARLSKEELDTLIDLGLIDPNDSQLRDIDQSYMLYKNDRLNMNITIELTNACNLRCKYCYQEHNPDYLSKLNSDNLLKFIESQASMGLKTLHIHWFGGEPTLNLGQASYLDAEIRKISSRRGLDYNSSITTNGYDIIADYNKYLSKMRIASYQITLDGIKDRHDFSRPHIKGGCTFDSIVKSVKYLMDKGENITLRYNVNKTNRDVKPFLDFLKENRISKNIGLHIQPTTNFDLSEDIDDFYFKSNEEYSQTLKEIYRLLLSEGYQVPKYAVGGTNCPFDCRNNFMITSNLDILRCSSCDKSDQAKLGSIREGKIIYRQRQFKEKLEDISYRNDRCLECKVLPICKGGCYLKRSLNMDGCIPELYFLDDYIKLLYEEELNVQDYQGQ